MTTAITPAAGNLASYFEMERLVRQTLLFGERQIEVIKVVCYWRAGSYINEHVKLNGGRAEYGKKTILKLQRRVHVDKTILARISKFAAKFHDLPIGAIWHQLSPAPRQIEKMDSKKLLSWSHYRVLLPVEDAEVCRRLAQRALRWNWAVERLEDEIGRLKIRRQAKRIPSADGKDKSKRPDLIVPRLGKLYTYRLVDSSKIRWPEPGLLFDRGFKSYDRLARQEARGFGAEEIVEVKGGRLVKSRRTAGDLFTYLAYVDYVIDGDTLWVALDTGRRGIGRQKLRLRGIDSPEIKTAAGRRARDFLKKTLAGAPYLIVRTFKNDKYDRYETDLFIPAPGARSLDPAAGGLGRLVFINNLMLERGHARRVWEQ